MSAHHRSMDVPRSNSFTSSGGQDPGYIEIQHPTASSFHSGGVVNIEGSDNDGPDTILHEYGHALMYRAFGNTSVSPGGAHGFDDDAQDPGLAWAEGWATGYMLTLCPDGEYNWHEGATEGAGEWPACTSQSDFGRAIERFSDAGNRVGENTEGRVAAAINEYQLRRLEGRGFTERRRGVAAHRTAGVPRSGAQAYCQRSALDPELLQQQSGAGHAPDPRPRSAQCRARRHPAFL